MTECQAMHFCLLNRYREQARSHRGLMVFARGVNQAG